MKFLSYAKELFRSICTGDLTVSARDPEIIEFGLRIRRRKKRNEDTGKTDTGDCGRDNRDIK